MKSPVKTLLAVAATALALQSSAGAAQMQILVNTGTSAISQPGVTWNNITLSDTNVPLYYSDGTLSGLTYSDLDGYTGSTLGNDTRYTPAATLAGHPLSWVSSLSEANRAAFATNFAQNDFESPTEPTNLNIIGFSGLTGRAITTEVVATYHGNNIGDGRLGDYKINGQFTTLDGGAAPTYKPSDNYNNGDDNLNYMLWQNLPWGSGAYTGDQMTVSFERATNTTVINGFSVNYQLPGIVADFTGGAGTTSVDQFGGKAGDGWTGAWNKVGGTTVGTLTDVNPINGGGNYLAITDLEPTGGGYTREATSFADINFATSIYTLELDFRIDSAIHNNMQMGLRGGSGVNTGSDVLANIKAVNDTWRATNGNGSGGSNDVNTGLAVVSGDTYHVEFQFDPNTLTYILTLDNLDDELPAYVSGVLNWRRTTLDLSPTFFIGKQFDTGNPGGEISFDSLLISIPTPAALPAGLSLLGLLVMRRKK
ncbi:hypothetical protein HED60_02390 [Planctomycetales bacterium ZRK34]|nr:hypothetical protein HED60_02390 [Planctomycetales bacterium ZRK34]